MTFWDHYYLPVSVDEALARLAQTAGQPGGARVVAGGTDLLLELQQGRKPRLTALVDVTRIPEMTVIVSEGDDLLIGARGVLGVAERHLNTALAKAGKEAGLARRIGGGALRNAGRSRRFRRISDAYHPALLLRRLRRWRGAAGPADLHHRRFRPDPRRGSG